MEKIATCEVSFIPIGSADYLDEINQVLDIIKDSGLDHETGPLSTVVRGEQDKVFPLMANIYQTMNEICYFRLDVKLSNLCGRGLHA